MGADDIHTHILKEAQVALAETHTLLSELLRILHFLHIVRESNELAQFLKIGISTIQLATHPLV